MISKGPGEPLLFIYTLKPGRGADYERAHQSVWPEVLDLIDEAGIYDYQIWRHGDLVVTRMRTRKGYDHARAVTRASAVQKRWTESLGHVFAEVADASGDPFWLTEIFSHQVVPAGDLP